MVVLIAWQTESGGNGRRKHGAFGAVALLCLVLLALLITVQVAHNHLTEGDADHCSLCIALHSAAPITAMATVVVLVRAGAAVRLAEARPVIRHWNPKLFTRPPPVDC
ncbi:MAG: hypothetical protein WB424_13550 [Terracidiphilus sp.]